MISGLVYVVFSGPKCFKNRFIFLLLLFYFLAISGSIVRRLGLPNRGFRKEGIAKIEARWLLFRILGLHFRILGAPEETIFALRDHLAPWDAILAPRDHPGEPWE